MRLDQPFALLLALGPRGCLSASPQSFGVKLVYRKLLTPLQFSPANNEGEADIDMVYDFSPRWRIDLMIAKIPFLLRSMAEIRFEQVLFSNRLNMGNIL